MMIVKEHINEEIKEKQQFTLGSDFYALSIFGYYLEDDEIGLSSCNNLNEVKQIIGLESEID